MTCDESQAAEDDVALFMDLLSHDILNSNQAVLSYLELILESPDTDDKTKKYAAKAASQLRTSAMLVENLKGVVAILGTGEIPSKRTALRGVVDRAAIRARGLFPDRKLDLEISGIGDKDEVIGDEELVQELLDNLLMNSVQLDHGDRVAVRVGAVREDIRGERYWRITVDVPNGTLPEASVKDFTSWFQVKDISKMVRISGLLYASMIAEVLGGSLEPRASSEKNGGCSFGVLLREGRP